MVSTSTGALRRIWLPFRVLAGLSLLTLLVFGLSIPAALAQQTVTFDNMPDTDAQSQLTGQFPQGVIDWGSGQWFLSGPWQALSNNSISFNGDGPNNATFSFVSAHQLLGLDAYNGSEDAATVSLSCPGQPDKQFQLDAGELRTLSTGWGGTCSSVTITTSNGWETNFDRLVIS